ncbi:TetR/AcrR family transcriptional regulator [Rhodospirillaceae bacterium KN72]|uniref:TetR/AcrR family transcriptional regulator n=1 Tax=Pacificispira spongiicola TaxID=2729598 RepID=A0A7Y0E3B7_9PROT|nr:TetR family transcriptional regulator [Pacificispira spongiicola]NMM46482.1 TetR/AcrR family transcriptional regulator [Pacificispira spongiicola]
MPRTGTLESKKNARRSSWKQNPQAVQENILRVAQEVFSRNGLSGARVDEIVSLTETSKRMIYYYFGDKEGLYRRTLEEAYRKVRQQEVELDLDHLAPLPALEKLVRFTFRHHRESPDFIRLVMIENIHHGTYLAQSDTIRELNRGAISQLERILARGKAEGVFRPDADPLTVHWQISAMSFFNVSNRATFSLIFGDALNSTAGQDGLETWVADSVRRMVVPSNPIS